MKRSFFDTLRRGLDNAVANWGLIVVRVIEVFLIAAVSIAVALAILAPMLVSVGITLNDMDSLEDLDSVLVALMDKWVWLVWIFLAVSVLLLVFLAAHSFVEAGCARVAVDADRAAGPAVDGPRSRYRVFSTQRWWQGGKDGWWTVFWIYNFAWGVAGLILLIPLLPTAVIMLFTRDSAPGAMIATGCIGLTFTLLLLILVGIVTSMWTTRATTNWAADRTGASASLSNAWTALKADLGRHVLIALALVVIAMAGGSFFGSFSYMAMFAQAFGGDSVWAHVFGIPLRVFSSLCSWTFSGFTTSWFLAGYAALTVEGRQR